MKRSLLTTCLSAPLLLWAQVAVDVPVRLIGTDGERAVDNVAAPVAPTSAITLHYAVTGTPHWAEANMAADTVELSVPVLLEEAQEGLMLRFNAPQSLRGDVFVRLADEVLPLQRPDGLTVMQGQVRAGTICEVVLHEGRFVLMAPEPRGCPEGSLPVNDRYCIAISDITGVNYYQAHDACGRVGGRLCKWDEYLTACLHLEDQLLGLFDGWEWIDDTSDHTHTGDQAGNATCLSRRDRTPPAIHQTRCCFYLR